LSATFDAIECCAPLHAEVLTAEEAEATADLFKALADPARIRIINVLATNDGEPVCICHLTEPLGLSQPTVSHHMKRLLDAGLVEREQRRLEAVTLHECRHGFASFLDAAGITETRSDRYLGHARKTTGDRYRHRLRGQLAEDAKALDAYLRRQQASVVAIPTGAHPGAQGAITAQSSGAARIS
jgi:ArsR family transcriptional regulator